MTSMADSYGESDEAFARRLQAQEMGNFTGVPTVDSQTPLVNRVNENPTVINARLNEVQTARAPMYLIFIVYGPQVLASFIVLGMHWNEPNVCDLGHTLRWKWWALMSALRMFAFMFMVYFMDLHRVWLAEHREYSDRMRAIRNTIDAFGLIWFVVGNMWLFGDDNDICHHPERSPIYNLCLSLLVLNYMQICFPCIIAILLIPVFCFCMPCLIRVLARLQDPRTVVGATDAIIETLPEVVVDSSHLRLGQDNTCPICLSEMAIGDAARVLRCSHIFHKQCVDEWLRVNASCPTCRKRIIEGPGPDENDNNSNNNNSTTPAANTNTSSNSQLNPMLAGGRMSIHPSGEVALLPFTNRNSNSRIGAVPGSGAYSLLPSTSTHGANNNSSSSGGGTGNTSNMIGESDGDSSFV